MQIPSLQKLVNTALNVVKRFPFEILSVLTGTVAAIFVVELQSINQETENIFIRLIMAAETALLLSLAATLFAEGKNVNAFKKLMLRLAGIFLAVLFFFLIHPEERQSDFVRYFLLILSFHLLVAFAAFTGKNRVHAFWQFNKTLFLRILTSALYSAVLFLGISAAIGAMNFLFGFKFEWDTFVILWIVIAGLFNTTFFLAGVPDNLEELEQDYSYPKGLKLFTQYVLIPLASIYVLILLAYEIKILLEWNLPKGLVSNLILCYAVFGILSLLLVYPVRNLDENKWLKTYSRNFYFLLIPLLLLLFVAVGTRFLHYGITEKRYFLILLAVWLFAITIYFLVSKKQNIKFIPVSLCVVTLFSIYGPQSAFSMAQISQRQILINIFKKYHAVFNGKLSQLPDRVSTKDGNRAAATLQYLISNYDFASFQPIFSENLTAISDSLGKQKQPKNNQKINNWDLKESKLNWVKSRLGLKRFSGYDFENETTIPQEISKTYYISPINQELTAIKGYDYLINAPNQDSARFVVDQTHFALNRNYSLHFYSIRINGLEFNFKGIDVLDALLKPAFNLNKYLKDDAKSNADHYYVPAGNLSTEKKLGGFTVNFQVSFISFSKNSKGNIQIQNIQGDFLIKKTD